MNKIGRNRRRGLGAVFNYATSRKDRVIMIESAGDITGVTNFDIGEEVRNDIGIAMRRAGDSYIELVSGDYLVCDVTKSKPARSCLVDGCKERASIQDYRLIFVYDREDLEYRLDEFNPDVRHILQATRRRAVACNDDLFEAMIRDRDLDIYESIPTTERLPAKVSRIRA